jgi:probable rRNA maturation factor
MDNFCITATAHDFPDLPYQAIKNDILGKRYQLSLAFVGGTRAQALNVAYRNKDYTPNVLSFPLDTAVGEIFITPTIAKKEAKKFEMTPDGYIGFLFVHGCLHLKGLDHGKEMEALEQKFCRKYRLN